jgi:hypothetical protein
MYVSLTFKDLYLASPLHKSIGEGIPIPNWVRYSSDLKPEGPIGVGMRLGLGLRLGLGIKLREMMLGYITIIMSIRLAVKITEISKAYYCMVSTNPCYLHSPLTLTLTLTCSTLKSVTGVTDFRCTILQSRLVVVEVDRS